MGRRRGVSGGLIGLVVLIGIIVMAFEKLWPYLLVGLIAWLVWYFLTAKERDRRRKEQELLRQQESWWKSLDGSSFERELASLLKARGYGVSLQGSSGDGGVDIVLRTSDSQKIIVQCKAHTSTIGPGAVRELYGTMSHAGADESWLVVTSGFTRGCWEFAAGKPIRLLTIRDLLQNQ